MQARQALLCVLLASALLAGGARGPDDDDDDEYEREQEAPVETSGVNADGLRTATVTVQPPAQGAGPPALWLCTWQGGWKRTYCCEKLLLGAARTGGIFPDWHSGRGADPAVLRWARQRGRIRRGEGGVPPARAGISPEWWNRAIS